MRRTWEQSYDILVQFHNEFGHCNVKYRDTYNGYALGSWLYEQRKAYNKCSLPNDKILLLDELGVSFDGNETSWLIYFDLLKEYKNTFGDVDVPKRYSISFNGRIYNLGAWVFGQRDAYFHRYDRVITPKHIEMLDTLGFNWKLNGSNFASVSFNESAIFYYVSKLYPNACKYHKDGIELDIFIPQLNLAIEYDGRYWHSSDKDIEKNLYCKKNNIKLIRIRENGLEKLSDNNSIDYYINPDNKKELESVISTIFKDLNNVDIKNDTKDIFDTYHSTLSQPWKNKFALCKAYVEENGIIFTESYITKDGVKLGSWLHDQRKAFNKGKMPQDRLDMMNSLHIKWVA